MMHSARMISCFISRRVLIRLLDQCTVYSAGIAPSESREESSFVRQQCILYLSIRLHAFPLHASLRGVSAIGPRRHIARCVNNHARIRISKDDRFPQYVTKARF